MKERGNGGRKVGGGEGANVVLLVVAVAGWEGLGGLPVPSGSTPFCGL